MKKPRNKFERKIYLQLKRSKVKFKYESEHIPYILSCHYVPDFIITNQFGKIYIECKGYFRPEDKRKLLAVKRLNPQIDLRLVFYASSKTNIKWADRHGFKYAISTIPQEWLYV